MAEGTLFDKIQSIPKWMVVAGGVVLIAGLAYIGAVYGLGLGKKKPQEDTAKQTVMIDMPEAITDNTSKTISQIYRDSEFGFGKSATEAYWDNLGSELVSSAGSGATEYPGVTEEDIRSGRYTQRELDLIRQNPSAKQMIDEAKAKQVQSSSAASELQAKSDALAKTLAQARTPQMSQAQRDSMYFANMERALEMAAKYNNQPQVTSTAVTPAAKVEEEPKSEPERRIDLSSGNDPLSPGGDDGIISSLDTPSSNGIVHSSGRSAKPVKATFLKNEKLTNKQRVIIRLMQDLLLTDGTVIPANTHITGTCQFSGRLKINVNMLHYGGRMFPVDLSIYDNDGTEGLYCPVIDNDSNNKKKIAKDVGSAVISAAGAAAGTLLGGATILAPGASRAISSMGSLVANIDSQGSVSVDVTAGYEFYVFENVKEDFKR